MILLSKAIGDGLTPQTAFRPVAIDDIRSTGVDANFTRLPDGDFVCVLPKTAKDAELLTKLSANKDVKVLVEDYTIDKDVAVKKPADYKGVPTTGTTKDALLRLLRVGEPTIPDDYLDKKAVAKAELSPQIVVDGEVLGGK